MKRDLCAIHCMCFGHMVEFEREERGEVELSIWVRGFDNPKMRWRERLTFLWLVITTGQPYADYLIMSPEDVRKLTEWLTLVQPTKVDP